MRAIKFILLLFFAGSVSAQSSDTMSVYFEFGEHDITPFQLRRIQAIHHVIYVNDLDTVFYIGMADSVSSIKDNTKLGERRAREVAKFSKAYFTSEPVIIITSKGELSTNDPAINRRVDVVFQRKLIVTEIKPLALPKNVCLKRADSLFHRSLIRDVQYRRNDYVLVETIEKSKNLYSKYFYMSRMPRENDKDTFYIKELKWSQSNSKSTINNAPDYYTKIPKADFDDFGIFSISEPPCSAITLDKDVYFEQKSGPKVKCLQVDRFLMHHLEVQRIPFNTNEVYVRVPKVYINLDEVYLFQNGETVKWSHVPPQSKKRKERVERGKLKKSKKKLPRNTTIPGLRLMTLF